MWSKKGVAVAAALVLSGTGLQAAPVITGWNTDNVAVSTAINGVAGESVIYDRAPGEAGARSSGKVVFDGSESDTPGLKIVNDAAPGVPPSNGDVYNCVMANSPASCNSAKQSGKRLKFQRTGHEATDLVFNLNPDGTFSTAGNDGLYKFFTAFGNATDGRLGSFQVSLGTGVGTGFVGSGIGDGLSFKQSFDGREPNNSQFSALFANGLFGDIDDVHTITGYFSQARAGFDMAFTGEDRFVSTGLFGDYASLFGPMLSYGELPLGFFYDSDGNADTDDVLVAHQLADGSWVQNREILGDGSVATLAYGHDGIAYDSLDALLIALSAGGLQSCADVGAGTACLAGADSIDDLAKFNLTFFVDPTGFDGDQFTLRIESSAVPEPGSLALAALALGVAGTLRRRRG
ncbi:choice-of-anchor F family protein [Rubrivivax albus]|nr:choice-of-anchor F family protein [Rubrivivax albus]